MSVAVYVEAGQKRTFAGAIDWPGWCRTGKDEASALQALLDYAPRYAKVLQTTNLRFPLPEKSAYLKVIERLEGGSTTDFGAPEKAPRRDTQGMKEPDLRRYEVILESCWAAFDAAAESARGKPLLTGPRGGGRDLEEIREHVLAAEEAYLGRLGWSVSSGHLPPMDGRGAQVREAALTGLRASARGEISPKGPRGGKRWSARYFVRRVTWHVLDHAWEIEDRLR